MPKGNMTKVVKSGEQYRVTISKGIAKGWVSLTLHLCKNKMTR